MGLTARITLVAAAGCAAMAALAGCGNCCNKPRHQQINTTVLRQDAAGSIAAGASFSIPAGTTVVSNSVDDQGHIAFSVTELPDNVRAGFGGVIYGGATFTPVDAYFDPHAHITLPAGEASKAAEVYHLSGHAVSAAGWVLVGRLPVVGGKVSLEVSNFGHYVVGLLHGQGGGGSL